LAPTIVAAVFTAFIGAVLLLLSPDPARDWGYWFALGFLAYAFVIGFYGSIFFVRLFRRAKQGDDQDGPAQQTAAPNAGSAHAPPARADL
jgi:hypothetical protein